MNINPPLARRSFNTQILVKGFGFAFLFIFSAILIIPFLYLFVSSVKTMGQFYETDFVKIWFPWPLHFENYEKAWTWVPLGKYLLNSVVLSSSQTILCVASSSFVAFGFARFRFPGREVLFILVLSTMMLPSQVTQIPLFIFYAKIGLLNYFPLIIPYLCGSAWHIFLIRQFMMTIPVEMEEAALMDGCSTFRIYWNIILPQSIPVLFVSGLFQFLYSWKDFLAPLIYIKNKNLYPLTVGLLFFESPTEVQYTIQLAAVVISLVPTVIFFIIGRRYLIQGIQITDLK
jgi:ABC-type glycerol-3-phosphate transport system permease component